MKFKLVAFTGGTLTRLSGANNFWDFIRQKYDIPNMWKRYVSGEIPRDEVFGEYLHWQEKGLTKEKLEKDVQSALKLAQGSKDTFDALGGTATSIISDSPDILVNELARRLEPKYVACDEILFNADGLPYSTQPQYPTADSRLDRAAALKDFCNKEGCEKEDTAAIGYQKDHVALFNAAGFSVAFNPRDEEVRNAADVVVEADTLKDVLKHL